MADRSLHSIAFLRQLLTYDAETGEMLWLPRPLIAFTKPFPSAEAQMATWNKKNAGKQAFTAGRSGYRNGAIFGVRYSGHRLAWALHFNEWPKGILDHINGDRADNRIANLRDIRPEDNALNVGMPVSNKSGFVGVYQDKQTGRWNAEITYRGKKKYLGYFNTIGEAAIARREAAIDLGFFPEHATRPSHAALIAELAADASARQGLP